MDRLRNHILRAALVMGCAVFAVTLPVLAADSETEQLRKRVEQLEEQIVDMQVIIGTLESLTRPGGVPAQPNPSYDTGGGGQATGISQRERARMNSMETQIKALTAQVEQLLQSRGGASATNQGYGYNNSARLPDAADPFQKNGFGSTTITQTIEPDPIGGMIDRYDANSGASSNANRAGNSSRQAALSQRDEPVTKPRTGGGNSKALYETAYNYLLQQDYGAAEVAFDDFLRRYPTDGLAGNAQYWLGESYYVRGDYKSAAGAFLRGYQTYSKSAKAPDSLLKLAMSLDRMGQKDAACSSYDELLNRFPKAPAHVKNRAASERRRVGC